MQLFMHQNFYSDLTIYTHIYVINYFTEKYEVIFLSYTDIIPQGKTVVNFVYKIC